LRGRRRRSTLPSFGALQDTMVEPGNASQGCGSNAGLLGKRHRFR